MKWPWKTEVRATRVSREEATKQFLVTLREARQAGVATLRFNDPELGEVRAAFYEQPKDTAGFMTQRSLGLEESLAAAKAIAEAQIREDTAQLLGIRPDQVRPPGYKMGR